MCNVSHEDILVLCSEEKKLWDYYFSFETKVLRIYFKMLNINITKHLLKKQSIVFHSGRAKFKF